MKLLAVSTFALGTLAANRHQRHGHGKRSIASNVNDIMNGADMDGNNMGEMGGMLGSGETYPYDGDDMGYGTNGMGDHGMGGYGMGDNGMNGHGMGDYGMGGHGMEDYGMDGYGKGGRGKEGYGKGGYGDGDYGMGGHNMGDYGMDGYGKGGRGKEGYGKVENGKGGYGMGSFEMGGKQKGDNNDGGNIIINNNVNAGDCGKNSNGDNDVVERIAKAVMMKMTEMMMDHGIDMPYDEHHEMDWMKDSEFLSEKENEDSEEKGEYSEEETDVEATESKQNKNKNKNKNKTKNAESA